MRASLPNVWGAPPPPVRVGCLYYIGKGQAFPLIEGVYTRLRAAVGDQIQGGAL